MDQDLVTYLQIGIIGLISLCCLGGLVLQIFAWRHLKPGIPKYGHKDALFNKKHEYYTEEGMKYVDMQKLLLYVMGGLLVVFFIVTEIGRPDAPPGHVPGTPPPTAETQ
jgi:hypothetical protein